MANNAGKEKLKKTNIDEQAEFLDEEESNKKAIILLILFILVVLGLIFGSIYYFNNKGKDEPKDDGEENTPVEVVPMPDRDDNNEEEQESEDQNENEETTNEQTTTNTVANAGNTNSTTEEEVTQITYIFKDENGKQIGDPIKVNEYEQFDYPNVEEKDGYYIDWIASEDCNEGTTCTYQLEYIRKVVEYFYDDDENDDKYYVAWTSEGVDGLEITVNGDIKEQASTVTDSLNNTGRKVITLTFYVPDGLDIDEVNSNGQVSVTTNGVTDNIKLVNIDGWDKSARKVDLTLAVDDEDNIPTIMLDWLGDSTGDEYTLDTTYLYSESYTSQLGIELTDESDKEEAGIGDATYSIDAEVTSTNETTLTIEGEVNNYETKTGIMENVGFDTENNIVTLKFTAPTEDPTILSNMTVTTSTGRTYGVEALEKDSTGKRQNYFYHYQAVDPGTTSNPTIVIDWDGADSDTYVAETYVIDTDTIRLTPSTELDATVETPETETTEQNLVQNHDGDNIIEVSGEVSYNETETQNEITTTFKPMENVETGTSIKVNGETISNTDTRVTTDGDDKITSYTHTQEVTQNEIDGVDPAPTVSIDWNADNTNDITYEYDLTDATLETPPTP